MVANVPHCWPIVSRLFRLGSFKSIGPSGGATPGYMTGEGDGSRKRSRFSSVVTSMGARDNKGYMQSTHDGVLDVDNDSIEGMVGKAVSPSKDDAPSTHTEPLDIEMGPLPPAVMHPGHAQKPPEYEAHATAARTPGGFWIPDRVGGHSDRRKESVGAVEGRIVKTIDVDQRYEE